MIPLVTLCRKETIPSGSKDQFSSSALFLLLTTVSNACLFFLLFSLIGRELAWQFLQDNWDDLYNRYASGLLLPRLIQVNRQTPEKFTRVQVKVFVLSNETLYV